MEIKSDYIQALSITIAAAIAAYQAAAYWNEFTNIIADL